MTRKRYASAAGVIGFAGALIIVPVLLPGGSTAADASCPHGQVASVSKYAGHVCMAKPSKASKGMAQVVVGCGLGIPGGLVGMAYGCAGGLASVIVDSGG